MAATVSTKPATSASPIARAKAASRESAAAGAAQRSAARSAARAGNRSRAKLLGVTAGVGLRFGDRDPIVRAQMHPGSPLVSFRHRHLLGIDGLSAEEITYLLDLAERHVEPNRQGDKKRSVLRGRTIINLFFENSTRTRTSFELAGKRLGGDVINMSTSVSSIKKGETLIDTAVTLNAMHPDVLVVRHPESGAVQLLSEKVDCAVVNAGD
ncbi:MAG TPA: hypothetical protein VF170_16335, partial [Planctomycetaceae bacterium]